MACRQIRVQQTKLASQPSGGSRIQMVNSTILEITAIVDLIINDVYERYFTLRLL